MMDLGRRGTELRCSVAPTVNSLTQATEIGIMLGLPPSVEEAGLLEVTADEPQMCAHSLGARNGAPRVLGTTI